MFKAIQSIFQKNKPNSEASTAPNSEVMEGSNHKANLDSEKIKAIVAELQANDFIFEQAGFILTNVDIEIGLESRIQARFDLAEPASEEEQQLILSQIDNSPISKFVMMSLIKSSNTKALMDSTIFELQQVEISITSSPTVKTRFIKTKPVKEQHAEPLPTKH